MKSLINFAAVENAMTDLPKLAELRAERLREPLQAGKGPTAQLPPHVLARGATA